MEDIGVLLLEYKRIQEQNYYGIIIMYIYHYENF
jgi:hypothetical protein